MAIRFARAGLLGDILKAAKPAGPLDFAMRYGPDLFSIGAAGTAWAPPEADLVQRLGMMTEEGALSLPSLALGGIGRNIGRRRLLANRQGMSTADYQDKLIRAQQIGDFANLPIQMLVPRRYAESVYKDLYPQQQGALSAPGGIAEQQELVDQNQLAMALLASGALGGAMFGPRDSFSALRDPFDMRAYSGLN